MGPGDFLAMMRGWEYGREADRAENDRLLYVVRRLTFEVHRGLGGKALHTPQDLILLQGETKPDPEAEKAMKRKKAANLYKKAKQRGKI